jgi:SAM-dependent methyltransferase
MSLQKKYLIGKKTWDECAEVYERQIVGGHPDITAFEDFEEDFLDQLLIHLTQAQNRPIRLMDIGCGSGRLHIRYGTKSIPDFELNNIHPVSRLRQNQPKYNFDGLLSEVIKEVWGIDFSPAMIELAKKKIKKLNIDRDIKIKLTFSQGSAFKLEKEPANNFPVAVCLVNSIGVMQDQEGAVALFKSMRHAVEEAKGIAIISCYQKEYLQSYGLGQYESTLDVSGQPRWLFPSTYASKPYKQIPKQYKRAHSQSPYTVVDVYGADNKLVKQGYRLERDPYITEQILKSGHISTYSNYQSNWYSKDQIREWTETHWGSSTYHFETKELDTLRAEPAQMTIFDPGHHLKELFNHWNILKK